MKAARRKKNWCAKKLLGWEHRERGMHLKCLRSQAMGMKTPPPVPCGSSFGNPLKNWVPLGWVTDPATVAPTSDADGLACATRIKIKAPKAS